MNMGWAVLGVSTSLAVVAAVGLGVEIHAADAHTAPSNSGGPIAGPSVGVCGSPNAAKASSFHSMAASFVIKNTSDSPVRILALRPTTLVGLASARVTLAAGARPDDVSNFRASASVGVPAAEVAASSAVAPDGSTMMAAHAFGTVITSMTLDDGVQAGRAGDYEVVTLDALGAHHTQVIRASVGLGVTGTACQTLPG